MDFQVEHFEHTVYSRNYEEAGRLLSVLLSELDKSYGQFWPDFSARAMSKLLDKQDVSDHVMTRLASAITCLFSDPNFQLSEQGYTQLLHMQRWLATIFSITPFRNADHVIRGLNSLGWNSSQIQVPSQVIAKLSLLTFPDSQIPVDLDILYASSPLLAVSLAMVWLSPRFLGTEIAAAKREMVLGWLPGKLAGCDLDELPIAILQDVNMHCSYANRRDRHEVKKDLNIIIRKKILKEGWQDTTTVQPKATDNKPVMLVVLEWFSSSHSIYRTHSTSLRAARDKFKLVGMGYDNIVDATGKAVFDDFVIIDRGMISSELQQVKLLAEKHTAQILYMPSVGMFPITIFLANVRVAPLQLMALGHPATTHSPMIDYVVVEDDYVGDESCFSERLMRLPKDALPYVASAAVPLNLIPYLRENPAIVKIAVCVTTMKINADFLHTCSTIAARTATPVEFHFMVGQASDLVYPQVVRFVASILGKKGVVHPQQAYTDYMSCINQCDMFINPFPFGNTNGVIDVVTLGQVGVCLSGREVFEHIDEGLFRRLGVPDWLITYSKADYVAATIRLVDGHQERLQLRRELIAKDGIQILFNGRPELFGQQALKLLLKEPQVH